MKKVRFAIIGCGVIALHHANAVLNDQRAELVAVCDSNREKAEALAEKFGVKSIYTDASDMVKSRDIDAVCICTPSGLHGPNVITCAEAGKHILCEKPLDINGDVMTRMIRSVKDNHVKMGCVFQNRLRTGLRKAKEILESGQLGRMVIVECQYRGFRSPAYYKSAGWRGTWEMDGGGCLMNQGIHAIDALCWLAGDVSSVYAVADHLLRDIEVEDTANALLEFKNGAKGVIMGTTLSNAVETSPEGDYFRFECEKGSIIYTGGKTTLYLREWLGPTKSEVKTISLDADTLSSDGSSATDNTKIEGDGHSILASDLITAIIEDKDPYITGDSARKGVDVVLAIYESSRQGEKVLL